jgi:site-specific recombinase XerD
MQRKLDVELLPHWGERPIASITRADVKSLLREKARTSPIAANRLLALISKLFTWALDEEIITASPAVRLPRLGVEHERERSLTSDEIRTLWDAFDKLGYPFGPPTTPCESLWTDRVAGRAHDELPPNRILYLAYQHP